MRFKERMHNNPFHCIYLLAVLLTACTPRILSSLYNTDTFQITETPQQLNALTVASSRLRIEPLGSATLSATNGTPPFSYSIISGSGSINATSGVFTATATNETVTIKITDSTDASGTIDLTVLPPFLVQSTQISNPGANYAYVDLVVDWSRRLAYASSREPGVCVDVIDFQNENAPVRFKRFATSGGDYASLGSTCLGVKLYKNGTRLVFSSLSAGQLEVWDLSNNPNLGSYVRLGNIAVAAPRRIGWIRENPNSTDVLVAQAAGFTQLSITEPGGAIASVGSFSYPSGCANFTNDVTVIDNTFALQGCGASNSPFVQTSLGATPTLQQSFPMVGGDWLNAWSAAVTTDSSKVFIGGVVNAFFSYNPLNNPSLQLTKRFHDGDNMRSCTFSLFNGKSYLFCAADTRQIYVYETENITVPKLAFHLATGVVGEHYGISVNPTLNRLIIITNKGYFIVGNLDGLPDTTFQPTEF